MTDDQYAGVIAKLIRAARLQMSTERVMQGSIEAALTLAKVPFAREKPLGPRDRPDFLLADGRVVLEAKLFYPKKAIFRQLERYAAHESVGAMILVTGTAMGMPPAIGGKPVYVVQAGMGTLGC